MNTEPFFTPTRCQNEAAAMYAMARRFMDRAERDLDPWRNEHQAVVHQEEAAIRAARARRLMGLE